MSEEVSSNVEVEDAIAFKAGLKKTLDINDSKLDSQGIGFKTEHAAAMLILIDVLRHVDSDRHVTPCHGHVCHDSLVQPKLSVVQQLVDDTQQCSH